MAKGFGFEEYFEAMPEMAYTDVSHITLTSATKNEKERPLNQVRSAESRREMYQQKEQQHQKKNDFNR